MLTEFGGAPVDGGTIPALIFADVVNAYLSVFEEEETTETTEVTPAVERPRPSCPADARGPELSPSCPRRKSCPRKR